MGGSNPFAPLILGGSLIGKKMDSKSVDEGSSPSPPAILIRIESVSIRMVAV